MWLEFELELKITIFWGMTLFSLVDMQDVSKGSAASFTKADH
jgi:hypothetical protein